MRFFTTALFASLAALVAAQEGPNPISSPTLGDVVEAGKPVKIVWKPTTSGKVTLVLRKGDENNLETVAEITETSNSGEYTWTPDEDIQGDEDYTIEIKDASGNSNYSPRFELESEGEGLTPTVTDAPTRTTTSAEETETETDSDDEETSTSTSASRTTTARPTPTADDEEEEEEEEEDVPNTNENSATKAASPLALIFCVAMAVAYLN